MLCRRFLMFLALAAAVLVAAPGNAGAADGLADAKLFIGNLANQSIATMTAKDLSDSERTGAFRKLFIEAVDLPAISHFVLGRHWRNASPDQQREFTNLFSDLLVLSWSARFKDAANTVTFQVLDAKPDVDQGVTVDSRILREKQAPVAVLWRLRPTAGGFRIIDLIVEGTSMQFQYRDEYAAVITQSGGKIEPLLEALREKVAQLAPPPPAH